MGGTVDAAFGTTLSMYDITLTEHPHLQIPALDFRGTPTGIDAVAVVRASRPPAVNTGMAGKEAGVGQVGAGLVTPPMDCFVDALRALAAVVPPT